LLQGDIERWDATSETLLFFAARHDHVARTILPALEAGRWVICDRFTDSTVAYQGYARGFSLMDLDALKRIAVGTFSPDLTLILDVPVDEGLARVGRRSMITDRFESLNREFHQRLREGFLAIAGAEPRRCAVIDASGDVDAVHHAVLSVITERLGLEFR
jgi:dTMP kinase